MKRFAFVAAMVAMTACNNAAKEKARMDSIVADSTAKAAAAAAEMMRVADSTKAADAAKAAAMKMKAKAPTKGTTKR